MTTKTNALQFATGLRDELRDRRQARVARRTMMRELAAYSTPAQVDDLLAAMHNQEGPETEAIRRVLTSNLHQRRSFSLIAS